MTDKTYNANLADKGVSASLMTISAGIFGTGLTLGFPSLENLSGLLYFVMLACLLAGLTCLALSIFWGGRGITQPFKPGPGNPFDKQARTLILGTVLLGLVFVVTTSVRASSRDDLLAKIDALEKKLDARFDQNSEELANINRSMQQLEDASERAANHRVELSNRITALEDDGKPPVKESEGK